MIGDILQPTHLLFILAVALLVLGPKRLPEVGRALGRGLRDFRSALNTDELREHMLSTTSTQTTTPIEQEPTPFSETPIAYDTAPPTDGTETPAEPDALASEHESRVEAPPASEAPTAVRIAEPTASEAPTAVHASSEPNAAAPAPDTPA